jgi:hypothetical protein
MVMLILPSEHSIRIVITFSPPFDGELLGARLDPGPRYSEDASV